MAGAGELGHVAGASGVPSGQPDLPRRHGRDRPQRPAFDRLVDGFRPHVWGFLFLSTEQGFALRWWLPGWAVLAGAYAFVVSLAPRHQIASALIAVATLFSPIVQWWWMPTTLWPVAFGFVAMTAIWWTLNGSSRKATWAWAGLASWTGITMVMSIYVPFMVAAIVVAAPFALGAFLMSRRERGFARTMRALLPLGVCGPAGLVVVAWAYTRRDTVSALLSTVYPGARLEATGSMPVGSLKSSLGAVWNAAFTTNVTGTLGVNESEASTPLMLAPFLAMPLVALVFERSRRTVNWLAVAALASTVTVLAFWLVHGWDALAHLLLLDRSTAIRLRLAFLLLGVVAVAILARAAERRHDARLPWASAAGAVVVTVSLLVWVWLGLRAVADPVLASAWKPVALFVVIGVGLVALQRVTWGALALAVASLMLTASVNPLYRGVFDLSQTNVGKAVLAAEAAEPGTWVGTGGWPTMAVLMQTGVRAYNGVQTYPSAEMWSAIDPTGQYQAEWNRLAHVNWTIESGEPRVSNPQPDVVLATFDPCSSFAQQRVTYLLAREPVTLSCLTPVSQTQDGPFQAWVYRVVPEQPTEAAS